MGPKKREKDLVVDHCLAEKRQVYVTTAVSVDVDPMAPGPADSWESNPNRPGRIDQIV